MNRYALSDSPNTDTGGAYDLLTAAACWARYHDYLMRLQRAPMTVDRNRRVLFDYWGSIAPRLPFNTGPQDLDRFLAQPSGTPGAGRRPRQESTQGAYGSIVATFYKRAVLLGMTSTDRMSAFIRKRRPRALPRALTDAEIEQLYDYLDELHDPRMTMMTQLAHLAGLRVSEIAGLRIEGLQLHGRQPWMDVFGKGRKWDRVPISDLLAGILRNYLAGRGRTGQVIEHAQIPGRAISPRTVTMQLAGAMRAAGLNETAHALRHTFATTGLALGEGRNIHAVQVLMRHVQITSTQIYVSGFNEDARATANLFPDPRARSPGRKPVGAKQRPPPESEGRASRVVSPGPHESNASP